jgi:ADP-ribose pyrophosphatase YjhB (NUDIX family)
MHITQEEWEASIERVGVVAGCLIKKDTQYLLVQEKQPRAYGLWNLPAGHVDKGEELEHAAIREAKEETGLDVRLIEEIALYHEATKKTVKHIYSAEIIGGELTPQEDEILDVKWLTFDEVKAINEDGKLRAPWIWDIIQKDHLG